MELLHGGLSWKMSLTKLWENTTLYKQLSIIMLGLAASTTGLAATDTDQLQKEIEQLKSQNKMMLERLDATSEMLEKSSGGMGTYGSNGRTTLGGYGELHYNNLANQNPGGSDQKEVDFHRFIMFVGHEFNNKIRFWSELEVEHSQVGEGSDGGEVAMEQAFLEFDINENMSTRAGILLVPVGIINETHEPPTFYGVERNNVENYIIPTTWREGGVSIAGHSGSISYDLAVHSGLQTSSASNYAVRSARRSVREAPANDLAYTARIKWTGVPGLELATSLQYQTNVAQSTDPSVGAANLIEAHAVWQQGRFNLRALYATWNLDGSGPAAVGANEQTGWYIEPAFRITPKWGVFARYNNWDNRAGDATDSKFSQMDVGLNYWPHKDVVVKFDYQNQDAPDGSSEFDGINIGVGYQF